MNASEPIIDDPAAKTPEERKATKVQLPMNRRQRRAAASVECRRRGVKQAMKLEGLDPETERKRLAQWDGTGKPPTEHRPTLKEQIRAVWRARQEGRAADGA